MFGAVKRINGEFLRHLERDFECRGEKFKVTIYLTKVKDNKGNSRDYFPSRREELVEDALRKIAVEGHGFYLDEPASVGFTLYQLQKELKDNGHSYSIAQIKEALQICNRTTLSVEKADGTAVFGSTMFKTLGLQTFDDWKSTGKKTRAFVRFNSLVTKSIKNRNFRQINYKTSMQYQKVIARQLHKRMSHHYTQASYTEPYSLFLSTIIRDFGLTRYSQLRDNLRDVEAALEEMYKGGVIMAYKSDKRFDAQKQNKLVDAKFTITPSGSFVSEMKRANKRHTSIKQLSYVATLWKTLGIIFQICSGHYDFAKL